MSINLEKGPKRSKTLSAINRIYLHKVIYDPKKNKQNKTNKTTKKISIGP